MSDVITDEMVEAACEAFQPEYPCAPGVNRQSMRAALTAALAALKPAPASDVIKALEAMRPHIEFLNRAARANDEMGRVVTGQVEAARALPALLDEALASLKGGVAVDGEFQKVPASALRWLFGEGPNAEGEWFGDGPAASKGIGSFWWRTEFRAMLPASPPPADDADVARGTGEFFVDDVNVRQTTSAGGSTLVATARNGTPWERHEFAKRIVAVLSAKEQTT